MNISIEDAISLHKIIEDIHTGHINEELLSESDGIKVIYTNDGLDINIIRVMFGNHESVKAKELLQEYFDEESDNENSNILD